MASNALEAMAAFDVMLLVVCLLVAMSLHQAGLSVHARISSTRGVANGIWLATGGLILGLGVSALGLTATLPLRSSVTFPYRLSPGLLAVSLAIVATGFALVVSRMIRPLWFRVAAGGLLWGFSLGIAHYLNLSALGWRGVFTSDLAFSAQAVAGAAVGGAIVVWSAIRLQEEDRWAQWTRGAGALTVLAAVPGAYYTARVSTRLSTAPAPSGDGSWFLTLAPEMVLLATGGVLAALLAVVYAAKLDLRLRRRQEETEAIRRSEDRFRSLIQASSQIVWTTAPNGEMVGDQASWAQFTGQNPKAYRGWGWFNAIHPDDREATAGVWEASLADRKSMEVQHRLRRYDGQFRDCIARVVPVLETNGSVREWVGTHTDVTERTRMQEERDLLAGAGRVLSSSLDERETVGAIAGLLVPRLADWCAIDIRTGKGGLERVIATHADPHRAAILRQTELDFVPTGGEKGAYQVLVTGESEMIREVTDDVLRAFASDEEEFRRLHAMGVASLLAVPLIARKQVLGVLTLALTRQGESYDLRDVALAEELARRSAIAIDNARLYSASRAAIQARDEVMSIVSHDLRNPLSTIAMTADLLIDLPMEPEEHRHHLEIIQRAASAMNRLIRDLLQVSQTDSDRLVMDLHPRAPGAIVTEAWEAMRPLAAEKSQRLTCEIQEGLPLINADSSRMLQVLSNLLGNAVKFVDEGGDISVRVVETDGLVQFSVLDSGPGIPPEDLPRVFDRHWRAQRTAHLGAGLGLAISRAIVEAHGGRIWAESEPSRGTGFHFTVPAASATEDSADSGEDAADGIQAAPSPIHMAAADR